MSTVQALRVVAAVKNVDVYIEQPCRTYQVNLFVFEINLRFIRDYIIYRSFVDFLRYLYMITFNCKHLISERAALYTELMPASKNLYITAAVFLRLSFSNKSAVGCLTNL